MSKSRSTKQRPPRGLARKPSVRRQGLVFQPSSHLEFGAGVDLVVNAISPTFGPLPRLVAANQNSRSNAPEILEDGAAVAKGIDQLFNRTQDVGAMFVRSMILALQEDSGDGTTTAALLFQSLFNQGKRFVEAGGNPMTLRYHLERLTIRLLDQVEYQSIHPSGKNHLARFADTICHDTELAELLGEIFDIIGEVGRLEIRSGSNNKLERYYSEGIYWSGGLFTRALVEDLSSGRTSYENSAILATDIDIRESRELVPVLDNARDLGYTRIVIIAKSITDRALGILLMETNRQSIRGIVVKLPGYDAVTQREFFENLTLLTGARPLIRASGQTLANVTSEHFGYARKIWANLEFFGVIGGRGDIRTLRHHILMLRNCVLTTKHRADQERLRNRIGQLMSGTATLYVGETFEKGKNRRQLSAKRTATLVRDVIRNGIVPGGGAALLSCRTMLREIMGLSRTEEERVACRILLNAVESPVRTLLKNSGLNPVGVMAEIDKAGVGYSYDVVKHTVCNMAESGIYDATAVTKKSLSSAIHAAALALTVGVIVHRKP